MNNEKGKVTKEAAARGQGLKAESRELKAESRPLKAESRLLKADGNKGKWIGIAAAVLLIAVLGLGFQQGWFTPRSDDGIVTLDDMKDDSWEALSKIDRERVETLLQKADNLYRQNQLVKPDGNNAYSIYKEVLKIHPGNKYALAQLGLIRDDFAKRARPFVEGENYDQAENILNAGLGYFPEDAIISGLKQINSVNRLYAHAHSQFKQKQPEQALNNIAQIDKIDPNHQPSRELKTEIGKYYLNAGDEQYQRKNYSRSIGLYEKAKPLLPENTGIAAKIDQAQRQIAAIEKARRDKLAAEERARQAKLVAEEKARQEAEAERQRQLAEQRKREEAIRNKYKSEGLVYVKGGSFMMGSNDGDSDEKPVHRVTVGDFYIGKYEVTQKQWKAVMGSNPSHFKGDNLPVKNVSWNDVQEFIRKLNARTGGDYRLPTEAEWEYAARGGNKSRGYKYSGSNDAGTAGWYDGNSGSKTHPVGQKQANELGLYDMSGNVWEWCSDWYDKNYYQSSRQTNPKGPSSGTHRVNRGGSWCSIAWYLRVAHRNGLTPDYRRYFLGFRLARIR